MPGRGAILVLPTSTAGQQGPVAGFVSTAGWAAAIERVVGEAWIVTTNGVVTPAEAGRRGSLPSLSAESASSWRKRLPTPVKTAIKDAREWARARRFRVAAHGPWDGHDVAFVWQRHELFHAAGIELARELGVPSVLFVPATRIWEAGEWGVRRPGWNALIERRGEAPVLRAADLIACSSDRVAQELRRLGVAPARILVTPSGTDVQRFAEPRDPAALRHELGLDGRMVVGWVGSFRRFHALDVAVDAVAKVDGAALLMVGDGPERAGVEALARRRGVKVVMTGTVPHAELPEYLGVMDVALVLAQQGQTFHYSPLKLAEYLAAGLPVVAPRIAQLEERLAASGAARLVAPGDVDTLADELARLRDDPALRRELSARARGSAGEWSWDRQVERVVAALG
jgi:glycosyltransferase involved in cell wall biosynthesis